MKVYANERVKTCLHTQRVQLNLDAVNGAPVCRSFSFFFQKRTRLKDYKKNVRKQINGKFYSLKFKIYPYLFSTEPFFRLCVVWLCEGVVPVMYINEQSPHLPMGRLLVKRLLRPLGFLFQLLDVGCLLHVHLVAVLVIEMVFKIGQLLVGDDSYSQSVLHLPFAVEGYYSFLYECIDVRMHV